ncbi:Uncharacterised protein [Vibrio cholerae]|nr:Uncharacterised protein [Vibrio cholerae]
MVCAIASQAFLIKLIHTCTHSVCEPLMMGKLPGRIRTDTRRKSLCNRAKARLMVLFKSTSSSKRISARPSCLTDLTIPTECFAANRKSCKSRPICQ